MPNDQKKENKNFEYWSRLIPRREIPRNISEGQIQKNLQLKKKSSLGYMYPLSLIPAPQQESLATSRYRKLRIFQVSRHELNSESSYSKILSLPRHFLIDLFQ